MASLWLAITFFLHITHSTHSTPSGLFSNNRGCVTSHATIFLTRFLFWRLQEECKCHFVPLYQHSPRSGCGQEKRTIGYLFNNNKNNTNINVTSQKLPVGESQRAPGARAPSASFTVLRSNGEGVTGAGRVHFLTGVREEFNTTKKTHSSRFCPRLLLCFSSSRRIVLCLLDLNVFLSVGV